MIECRLRGVSSRGFLKNSSKTACFRKMKEFEHKFETFAKFKRKNINFPNIQCITQIV